jgi:hypothetical protein
MRVTYGFNQDNMKSENQTSFYLEKQHYLVSKHFGVRHNEDSQVYDCHMLYKGEQELFVGTIVEQATLLH